MSIELKISILDGGTIHLTMTENSKLSDLRLAIKNHTGIEEDEQRLIYLGRVLREDKLLTEYNIHSGVCIQLVKAPAPSLPPPPSSEESRGTRTVHASYIIYLPFRVTESSTVAASESNEAVSHEAIESVVQRPIQGAPPVQRYSRSSLSRSSIEDIEQNPLGSVNQASSFDRLCTATAKLKRDAELFIQSTRPLDISDSLFHAVIHSYERLTLSLTDYYHSGTLAEQQDKEVIREALQTLQSVSSDLSQRLCS